MKTYISNKSNKTAGTSDMSQSEIHSFLKKMFLMVLACAFNYSFAFAQPVPTLSIEATPSSLISDGAEVEFSFNNTSAVPTEVGFYPLVEIVLPDGLSCDAACIASITYSVPAGAPVEVASATGAGMFINDVTGETTTLAAGETLLLFTLPVGSIAPGQPAIQASFDATFENDADFGVTLLIEGRGMFAIGDIPNGTTGDCGTQDTICEDATIVTNPTPSLLAVEKELIRPADFATSSGPTYPRTFDINVDVADGFEVTNVVVEDTIPTEWIATIDAACTGITIVPVPTTCVFNPDADSDGGTGGGTFTATFASVTGGATTDDISISYSAYIQEFDDANIANPVIDPVTGVATGSVNGVSVDYDYDDGGGAVAQVTATDSVGLTHSSIYIRKTASVTDNPPSLNSPGDVITWRTVIRPSDYFDFEDLDLDDDIQDGQVYNAGSMTVRVVEGANDITVNEATLGAYLTLPADGGDADSNPDPDGTSGITHFDLDISGAMADAGVFMLDSVLDGGSMIEVIYTTTISQQFIASTMVGNTQVIDGGDVIENNVSLMSKIVGETGTPSVGSSSSITIAPITTVTKAIVDEAPGPVDGQISPGDVVTFEVTIEVPSGDVENLIVKDFLPNPLFLSAPITKIADCGMGVFPGATQWCFANGTTISTAIPVTATNNTADNSITFDFSDGVENNAGPLSPETIVLRFAFTASNEPVANGLKLVNLLSTSHGNSVGSATVATVASIIELLTNYPEITVQKSALSVVSGDGTIMGNDFNDVDAGDVLEFQVTMRNDTDFSANDVVFSDVVRPGYVQTDGPAEFMVSVVDGGGVNMCGLGSFTDDSTPGLIAGSGITMPANSICILTYRLTVDSSALAGSNIFNRINVSYATIPSGTPYTPSFGVSRSVVDSPSITKTLVAGSSSNAASPEGDLYFGETVDFDFDIVFPEGSMDNVRVRERDLSTSNPAGNFFGNLSASDFEFLVDGSPVSAAVACAHGPGIAYPELPDVCFSAAPTFVQSSSTNHEITLGDIVNYNVDDSAVEALTIRATVTNDQITDPDDEGTYTNRAQLFWANSSNANNSLTGTASVDLLLPDLALVKTALTSGPVKIGDTILYKVRVENSGGAPAYDLSGFVDTLATGLGSATLISATHAGTDISGLGGFSFTLAGSSITITPVNASNSNQIDDSSSLELIYSVQVATTRVDDTMAGPGHPGGVVDGPGCVNAIGNSVDIASYAFLDGGPAAVTAIDASATSLALDSDGDGILNSIETVGLTCPDSDGDTVPDHLDTDSDDNGIGDAIEYNAGANLDSDALPDYRDMDDDMDGISDWTEIQNAGGDPATDLDGDGVVDHMDLDSDNDGILDSVEGDTDSDGDGVPNYLDIDSDNDGITDLVESQPEGVALVVPSGMDTDMDGIDNAFDSVPGTFGGAGTTPTNTDMMDLADYLDIDSDDDGVIDLIEGNDANGDGLNDDGLVDGDNDGRIDAADYADADNDGLHDSYDTYDNTTPSRTLNSPGSNSPKQNSDTIDARDWRDTDDDNDGILTIGELENSDGDLTPDYLEIDSDDDGINDEDECSTGLPCVDTDLDSTPDFQDDDSDNDGIPDSVECSTGAVCPDTDGDSFPDYLDLDSDNDGIADSVEGVTQSDADGIPDYLDIDSDNDGITDLVESQPEGVPLVLPSGGDNDMDGIDNNFDTTPTVFGGLGTTPTNTDMADMPDYIDTDSDNDGIFDLIEGQDVNLDGSNDYGTIDLDNDGQIDAADFVDGDGDGLEDRYDSVDAPDAVNNPNGANTGLQNADSADARDWRDTDDDNDGILTEDESSTDSDGGVPDYLEVDSDGDGIPDMDECMGGAVCADSDMDGIPNFRDLDSDNDGILDIDEGFDDFDGDGVPNFLDIDSDNDGILDLIESQPEDVALILPSGMDMDMDGLDDNFDGTPTVVGGPGTTPENTDMTDGPDYLDTDSDNDGVFDLIEGDDVDKDGVIDSGPIDMNNDGMIDLIFFADIDMDGLSEIYDSVVGPDSLTNPSGASTPLPNGDGMDKRDWRDTDDDNDGLLTVNEDVNMNGDYSDDDTDMDGMINYHDVDSDNDGILDGADGFGDTDGDGIPNYLDLDSDGDGISDEDECPSGAPCPDFDGDTIPDFLDIDSDNDGVTDLVESQPEGTVVVPSGNDTDMDGIDDAFDATPTVFGGTGTTPENTDGMDTPDYIDTDSDNDGVFDLIEGSDANGDGVNDFMSLDVDMNGIIDPLTFNDADGDGLDDAYDTVAGPDALTNAGGSSAPLQNSDMVDNRDWRDTDDDNDGILTKNEMGDTNMDGMPDYLDLDSDGDGVSDMLECPDMSDCPDSDGDGTDDHLDPSCNVIGVVSSAGVGQADVRIQNASGITLASTKDDGSFLIPNLGDGTYELEAVTSRGVSVGTVTVVALDDDCGAAVQIEATFALKSPLYFVWNGFYEQQNVVVLQNKGLATISATVTLVDLEGNPLSSQAVSLAAKSEIDLPINSIPGYSADTYGHVKVEFDVAKGFDGYFAHYRMSPDGKDVEFSIVRSFESAQTGRTSAAFNTSQPSFDADAVGDDIPNWIQVVNVNEVDPKTFVLKLYDSAGVLLRENGITLPPRARFDVQSGHEFPGLGNIGSMEVVPVDMNSPYLAQLYHYGADGPVATLSDSFSYASGEPTQSGDANVSYVPISSAAGGSNYLVVTNTEETAANVAIDIIQNDGTVTPTQNVTVAPKAQVHVDIQALIGINAIGLAKLTPTSGSKIVAKSMTYFRDANSHVVGVAGTISRPIFAGVQNTSYNTFLDQLNWLKIFNVTSAPITATVEVFNQSGVSIGSSVVGLAANSGADVELNANLGLGIPADSVGLVQVTPSVNGAVRAEMIRIKPLSSDPSIVDNAGFLPAR